ncbi:MAG: sensor histidine kinase [Longimicrobiales bacterium]
MTPELPDDRPKSPPAYRPIPFLGVVVVWLLFGLFLAQQNLLTTISSGGEVESWSRPFVSGSIIAVFWMLITPALVWSTRRVRERVRSILLRIAVYFAIFLVVHVAEVVIWVNAIVLTGGERREILPLLSSIASFNGLTYGVVVMVITALDYQYAFRERALHAAQLETQLALAQFQVLRAQLHPHFLFNSLNAISALMHKDVARADRMLARLSELLRIAIDTAATPTIRLIDEIEFVKRYLETEQMRFGDRLDVRVELPVETYEALVPTMLLQPLVENAVRHGVAPHSGPARVEIRAERKGARLGIVVSDTGSGRDPEECSDQGHARAECLDVNEGVGLRTTRERLEKLYGGAQELVLANAPGGGFETRVMIPFQLSEDAP